MTIVNPTPTPTPTPAPAPTPTPDDDATTDWKAEAEKLKAEARKWETRSKENAKAAARLSELEESQKTDLQKALDRADAAEKRAATLEAAEQITTWKTEISTATGVPAQYLRGATKDELQAHADELKPLIETRGPIVPTAGHIPTTPPNDARETAKRLFGSTT